jgi:hypothetical protein
LLGDLWLDLRLRSRRTAEQQQQDEKTALNPHHISLATKVPPVQLFLNLYGGRQLSVESLAHSVERVAARPSRAHRAS